MGEVNEYQPIRIEENGIIIESYQGIELPYRNKESLEIMSGDENEHEHDKFHLEDEESWTLVRLLFRQGFPIIGSYFIWYLGSFINMTFAGHYGYSEGNSVVLAGVALSNMFASVTLISILVGMSSAVETLASQNNGAKNYKEVGYVLQRSIVIMMLISAPLAVLWWKAHHIFLAVGIAPDVAEVIKNYLSIRVFAIPNTVVAICYEKYVFAIGVSRPSLIANISQNIVLLSLDYLFVFHFGWSYHCLAYAWVASEVTNASVQYLLSLKFVAVQRTLQPWSKECLRNWKEFITLGVPGAMMICSEWWAYEILTFIAASLGTTAVAAQAIVLQTISLIYMIPMGLGIAVSAVTGNLLGAGRVQLALRFAKLSLMSIIVVELIIGVFLYLFGAYYMAMYTSDKEILAVVVSMIPILSVATCIDGLQTVGSGVLRGAGKQWVGAVANIVSFYVIGIPLSIVLCFYTPLQVRGLMFGVYCGAAFQDCVLWYNIFCRQAEIFTVTTIEPYHNETMLPSSPCHSPHIHARSRTLSDDNYF